MKLRTYFLLAAILFPLAGAMAQPRPINKEVEVTRPYDPSVLDAQKLWFDPTINADSLKKKDPVRYSVIPQSISNDFGLNPIASATFVEDSRGNKGLGYIRLGAGYLPSTLADFYISNNARTALFGLYANHRGFWGDVELDNGNIQKDVAAENMSNDIGAFVKVPFSSAMLSVNVDYSGKRFLYYGYDPDWFTIQGNTYNKDDIRQTFNLYNANVQVESVTSGADRYDYGVGASIQHFANRFDMAETSVMGWAMLGKHWDGLHNLSATVRLANYNRNTLLDRSLGANTLFYVQPSYTYTNGNFTGKLGLSIVGDSYDDASKNKIYPALMASYRIADFFVPSVEVKGDTEANSYRKLAYDCNYVDFGNDPQLLGVSSMFRNTYRNLAAQLSVKGDIGTTASYNFYVSYSQIDNLPFFYNQSVYVDVSYGLVLPLPHSNMLKVAYDDGEVWNIGGELSLDISPFSIYAKAVYNQYDMDNLPYAIHRPRFETDIRGSFKLGDFVISGSLNVELKRYYLVHNISTTYYAIDSYHEMGNIYNLSGSVEYFLTDKFSVFGNINNLLNQSYEVYHQYRVPGMMLSGGLTYRF